MKNIIFIAIVLILSVSSCEKKLDIDLPDGDRHIVLNGIINPDSLIKVSVSKSQNILDNNELEFLPTAVVKLFKNDVFIENLISSENGLFISNIFPVINSNYSITVDYPGLNSVSANSVLHEAIKILSIDAIIDLQINDYGEGYIDTTYQIKYKIKIKDDSQSRNYYFLALSSLRPYYEYSDTLSVFMGYREQTEYIDTNDPIFRDGNNYFSLNGFRGFVFNDNLFNGLEYTIDISSFIYKYPEEESPDQLTVYIRLLTVNEELYRFITSYNLNQQSKYDPFAQPVQVYSNIENGLGLFSGYTMHLDSLIFDLK